MVETVVRDDVDPDPLRDYRDSPGPANEPATAPGISELYANIEELEMAYMILNHPKSRPA